VTLGGPAERGGIKNGDVIVGLAGKPVKDLQTYMVVMKTQKRGNSIEVEVVRQGKKVKLQVKLE
jgi:putative serine protease PepD